MSVNDKVQVATVLLLMLDMKKDSRSNRDPEVH